MAPKRPRFRVPWHPSEQPAVVADPALRRAARRQAVLEYIFTCGTALLGVPVLATRWATLSEQRSPRPPSPRELAGVGVTPRPDLGAAVPELLAELGVRRLLVRLPLWDARARDAGLAFIAAVDAADVLPVAVQNRDLVCDRRAWRTALRTLMTGLPERVEALQVGIAPNRLKWGCAGMGEYLDLLEVAAEEATVRPGLHLVGPAAIDFDPLAWIGGLWHRRRVRLHACTSLLYVDRRGGPEGRQYGLDLRRKLELLAAVVGCSPRCANRIWITEFNWPLTGSGDWSPTGPAECVSEAAAAAHLSAYLHAVRESRLVERAYWWQLVHPGYGLVDDRNGLRRRPAFHALRGFLRSGDGEPAAST